MDSDDFIGLDASEDNNDRNKAEESQGPTVLVAESECPTHDPHTSEGVLDGRNSTRVGEGEDDPTVLDMDLEDEDNQPVLPENIDSAESKEDKDVALSNGSNGILRSNNLDNSSIKGVKRVRTIYDDQQPSVRVIYDSLTRESKTKLVELMHKWADWQARHPLPSNGVKDDVLENGEETYFPSLNVGSEKTCTVSFWVDNQVSKGDELEGNSAPLYDRGYALVSSTVDGASNPEGLRALEDSRCFNCGSYSHALKECPKPRDNVAIATARKIHSSNSKRNQAASNGGQSRYYKKPTGKFDDLQAGVLGPETRECLGIGEHDPPPWFHRMLELGYPPGYLDIIEDEDQPSGIVIYAEETKEEYEDGELLERAKIEPPQRKMTVEFPGVNVPIPENADHKRWSTASSEYPNSNSSRNRVHHRSNNSSDNQRSHHHHYQARSADPRDEGPPGSEYALSSFPGRSPRYSPYDHNRIHRSPNLGRSISDRGWKSPMNYETSPAPSLHNPFPDRGWKSPVNYETSPAPSLHNPFPHSSYHHPNHDRWDPSNTYGAIGDSWTQDRRERHEYWRDHHHWR